MVQVLGCSWVTNGNAGETAALWFQPVCSWVTNGNAGETAALWFQPVVAKAAAESWRVPFDPFLLGFF